jgi:hypothetical protein
VSAAVPWWGWALGAWAAASVILALIIGRMLRRAGAAYPPVEPIPPEGIGLALMPAQEAPPGTFVLRRIDPPGARLFRRTPDGEVEVHPGDRIGAGDQLTARMS